MESHTSCDSPVYRRGGVFWHGEGCFIFIGAQSLLADLGTQTAVHMYTDSSAAKGIASRRGLGKVRHIEVNQLRLQDKVHAGKIVLSKVAVVHNRADILTKHASARVLEGHLQGLYHHIRQDRHHMMPTISVKGTSAREG